MRTPLAFSAIVLGATLVGGCGSPPGNTDGGTDAGGDPDLTCGTPTLVSTAKLHTDVMDPVCKTCHFAGGSGGIDFSTPAKLQTYVGAKSPYGGANGTLKIVDPNNPANSS